MKRHGPNLRFILSIQLTVAAAFAAALFAGPVWRDGRLSSQESPAGVSIARRAARPVAPLYDDPTVVSDADLAAVLKKIRPVFPRRHLKPNYVEHALRAWGIEAEFRDPRALSGREMLSFLTDHGAYVKSWDNAVDPLLVPRPDGVAVRWGRVDGASVHHDHLVACLSEAGLRLDAQVYPPGNRPVTFRQLVQRAVHSFRLDQREVEWSAMVFALWLPPETNAWKTSDGRRVNFDMIARRLMRGDARFGVCGGTHRVYSLMLLYRIDRETPIFTKKSRASVRRYLLRMRDLVMASQFPDGRWASNWSAGVESVKKPIVEPDFKAVIATGHHLEWLALAPPEFQPPRAAVRKAARWLIENVRRTPEDVILQRYTFYSHVGNALAMWRRTSPARFRAARAVDAK